MKNPSRLTALLGAFIIVVLTFNLGVSAQAPQSSKGWDDPSARFRNGFVLSNPSGNPLTNKPVFFYMTFPWGEVTDAYRELRIFGDSNVPSPTAVLCQTVQGGYVVGACLVTLVNITGSSGTYFAYYGDPAAAASPLRGEAGRATVGSPKFNGIGVNFTMLSTYNLNLTSIMSAQDYTAEGASALGGQPFGQVVSPWQVSAPPFSNQYTVMATTVANDSGLMLVRTIVGTTTSLQVADFVLNTRSTSLQSVNMLDFYDLSTLDRISGSVANYSPVAGNFAVQTNDASFQMSSSPQPYPVVIGDSNTVASAIRSGNLVSSTSGNGSLGIALGFKIGVMSPFSSALV
ncbi:MAG TPA: hypothetical protein VFE91_03680, partial [Nitrososphaerales archaeon]|nr:hypothetical protein [Nitrososphaerales archaeon]